MSEVSFDVVDAYIYDNMDEFKQWMLRTIDALKSKFPNADNADIKIDHRRLMRKYYNMMNGVKDND